MQPRSRFRDGKHVQENVRLWNAVAGSAQIVTEGVKTIPAYKGSPNPGGLLDSRRPGQLTPNSHSWYDLTNARTAIGLSRDSGTLFLFTVDRSEGSQGIKVGEVADLLIQDYGVYNPFNLDGGGSTTMAMEDAVAHVGRIVTFPPTILTADR